MKKKAGTLVQTASGLGIIPVKTAAIKGKFPITLVEEKTLEPILSGGKPKQILCDAQHFSVIGFID